MNYTINRNFRVDASDDWYVIPGLVLTESRALRVMRQAAEMPENGSYRRNHLRHQHGTTAWYMGNYYGVTHDD